MGSLHKAALSVGTWFGVPKTNSDQFGHKAFGYARQFPSAAENRAVAEQAAADTVVNDANAALLAENNAFAAQRTRRRGNALATGAGDSGSAATSSPVAYGKPTLGA